MMEAEHELKLATEYYSRVATGQKTFEIRKNDRDFQVGDFLILREYDTNKREYTGYSNPIRAEIIYMSSFMQQENYVVLGIKVVPLEE